MDKTVEPLSRELDFITFLPKYRITYGSVNESPVVISRKMALMLKFKGSVTRIVTDINLSSGSETQIEVRGLWDSGAMTCCIKKSLSDSLNLAIVGKHPMKYIFTKPFG